MVTNDALLDDQGVAGFVGGRVGGHLDLPRARAGGLAGGMFAVFTRTPGDSDDEVVGPDGSWEVPLAEPVSQPEALAHATAVASRLFALKAAGVLRVVRAFADLERCLADGVLAAVLHLEGAEAIDPDLTNLERWHEAGLRSLGPVWSRPNAFGHGVPFRFPSSPHTGPGLADAGKALVHRCIVFAVPFLRPTDATTRRRPSRRSSRTPATWRTGSASTTSHSAPTSTAPRSPPRSATPPGCPACSTRCEGGFSADEVQRIARGNWLRVLRATWG